MVFWQCFPFGTCSGGRDVRYDTKRDVFTEGREVEALRRMERIVGVRQRIEIRLSRASIEPGIFQVWSGRS